MKHGNRRGLKRAAAQGLRRYHRKKKFVDRGDTSSNENAVNGFEELLKEPIAVATRITIDAGNAAHNAKERARTQKTGAEEHSGPDAASAAAASDSSAHEPPKEADPSTKDTAGGKEKSTSAQPASREAPYQGIRVCTRDGQVVSDAPEDPGQDPSFAASARERQTEDSPAAAAPVRQQPDSSMTGSALAREEERGDDAAKKKKEQRKQEQKQREKRAMEQGRQLAQSKAAESAADMDSADTGTQAADEQDKTSKDTGKKSANGGSPLALILGAVLVIPLILIFFVLIFTMGTAFGLFYMDDGSLRESVLRINQEYEDALADIQAGTEHDELDMSGAQTDWRSVLAVYAANITSADEDPQELASMDEEKEELLRQIFWSMHVVSSRTDTYEAGPSAPPPEGSPPEEETGPSDPTEESAPSVDLKIRLYIEIAHVSAWEMANRLGFSDDQRVWLEELLAEENTSSWGQEVLYGISTGGDAAIVSAAASQVGSSADVYLEWYGGVNDGTWGAVFVSWCANECGYISAGLLPKFDSFGVGESWFKSRDLWERWTSTPAPGDIIFIDRDSNSLMDSVGIVEYVMGSYVHTIEGDRDGYVIRDYYPLAGDQIMGYGAPDYP